MLEVPYIGGRLEPAGCVGPVTFDVKRSKFGTAIGGYIRLLNV